jgi:hypothetical protein
MDGVNYHDPHRDPEARKNPPPKKPELADLGTAPPRNGALEEQGDRAEAAARPEPLRGERDRKTLREG